MSVQAAIVSGRFRLPMRLGSGLNRISPLCPNGHLPNLFFFRKPHFSEYKGED